MLKCLGGTMRSNIHTPQDDYRIDEAFVWKGQQYIIAALSDGATGETTDGERNGSIFYHSRVATQYGSQWLCEKFLHFARERIRAGDDGVELVREALLDIVDAIPKYPVHDSSTLCVTKYSGITYSLELGATLFACVASEDECAVICMGHGTVLFNEHKYIIDTAGGDIYPVYLVRTADRVVRRAMLDNWAVMFAVPTNSVQRLTLTSDGACEHLIERLKDGRILPEERRVFSGLHRFVNSTRNKKSSKSCSRSGSDPYANDHCSSGDDDMTYLSFVNSVSPRSVVDVAPRFTHLKNACLDDFFEELRLQQPGVKLIAKIAATAKKRNSSRTRVDTCESSAHVAQATATAKKRCAVVHAQKPQGATTHTELASTKPRLRPAQSTEVMKPSTSLLPVAKWDDPMEIPDNQIRCVKDESGAYHTRPDGAPLYSIRFTDVMPFENGIAEVRVSRAQRIELLANGVAAGQRKRALHINKRGAIVGA